MEAFCSFLHSCCCYSLHKNDTHVPACALLSIWCPKAVPFSQVGFGVECTIVFQHLLSSEPWWAFSFQHSFSPESWLRERMVFFFQQPTVSNSPSLLVFNYCWVVNHLGSLPHCYSQRIKLRRFPTLCMTALVFPIVFKGAVSLRVSNFCRQASSCLDGKVLQSSVWVFVASKPLCFFSFLAGWREKHGRL